MNKNCHMFRKGILTAGAIALAGILVCGCGNGSAEPAPTVPRWMPGTDSAKKPRRQETV